MDPSLSTQSIPHLRTVISLELSEVNSNLEATINKTDTSNSAIFVMTDTTNAGTGGGYFSQEAARTEAKVLAKQVIVPKDKRIIPGSRERGIYYLAATGALEQTFIAARHFVTKIWEGETDTYHNTQEMYVVNPHTLKAVRDRCVKYDMNDTLKNPSMIDETTTNPVVQ